MQRIDALRTALQQFGTFDFQRDEATNTFFDAYIHAANYAIGVYMAGAGYGLSNTLIISRVLHFFFHRTHSLIRRIQEIGQKKVGRTRIEEIGDEAMARPQMDDHYSGIGFSRGGYTIYLAFLLFNVGLLQFWYHIFYSEHTWGHCGIRDRDL